MLKDVIALVVVFVIILKVSAHALLVSMVPSARCRPSLVNTTSSNTNI